ncbi:glucose 1-dehydrogenase [Burkholderia multivorans]|uniref:SDR family NAD(P)-dependent oxidoreductase n=1 Tax=Burkholderia multivorans TaxID=87883 RepID=UPI000A809415|nr:glucose 1-dehydrogenase [Burkholderia multivorans]MCA8456816.1 glucose 1-dehydrogenase [Burkholderia multivorans]
MSELFDLSGTVALITGGSAGMGFAMARRFGEAGARVVIASNDAAGGESAVRTLSTEHGIDASFAMYDAGERDDAHALAAQVLARYGRVDSLVCNAGYAPPLGPMHELPDSEMHKVLRINLQGVKWLTDAVLPQMARHGGGSAIVMSSIAGLRGNHGLGFYGVAKAANAALVRNLAVEWGPRAVRVNAISPGVIDTEFAKPLTGNAGVLERRIAATPLRRIGRPDEVAGVALMLAAPAGAFITGQNIVVDGGTLIGDGN